MGVITDFLRSLSSRMLHPDVARIESGFHGNPLDFEASHIHLRLDAQVLDSGMLLAL